MVHRGSSLEEIKRNSRNKPQSLVLNLQSDRSSINKSTNQTSLASHSYHIIKGNPETALIPLRELFHVYHGGAEQVTTSLVDRYHRKIRILGGRIRIPRSSFIPVVRNKVGKPMYGRLLALHRVLQVVQEVSNGYQMYGMV